MLSKSHRTGGILCWTTESLPLSLQLELIKEELETLDLTNTEYPLPQIGTSYGGL